MPPMPAPPPPPAPAPVDSALRAVLVLMFTNLGLSVVLTILLLILHNSVIDFQLAHEHLPPGADPQVTAAVRQALQGALWGRMAGVLVVSLFYVLRARAMVRGSRRAYRRMILIAVVGLLGIAYLIAAGQYPVWMRVEQGLQAVVLISLLIALLRPQVKNRFPQPQRTL
jgi:hypothetical protein